MTLGHSLADPGAPVSPRVAINATRAAVSVPGVPAVDLTTGVQAGDKYTIERNNDTFRFGLTRGGAEIATNTMTVPAGSLSNLGFRTSIAAGSGAAGATFDDMKWEAL